MAAIGQTMLNQYCHILDKVKRGQSERKLIGQVQLMALKVCKNF